MSSPGKYKVQFIGTAIHSQHVQYHVKITDPSGKAWDVKKRYSEFRDLHQHLSLKFTDNHPAFPGKKFFGNMNPHFVSQRQQELQQYMREILVLDPEVRTKVLAKFMNIPSAPGSKPAESPKDTKTAGSSTTTKKDNPQNQSQAIVDAAQNAFVDLSETSILPKQLDIMEMQMRTEKYNEIMKDRVLDLPVDQKLIDRAIKGYMPAGEPQLAHRYAQEGQVMSGALDALLEEFATTPGKIGDHEKLIVPFPPVPTNFG